VTRAELVSLFFFFLNQLISWVGLNIDCTVDMLQEMQTSGLTVVTQTTKHEKKAPKPDKKGHRSGRQGKMTNDHLGITAAEMAQAKYAKTLGSHSFNVQS
jgi:hypothetical protein